MFLSHLLVYTVALGVFLSSSEGQRSRPSARFVTVAPPPQVPSKLVGNLLVICDKEFGERFQHNREKILDYWTSYMWDVNMRFKTLTTVNIKFTISHLVVIKNTSDQSFVEEARDNNGSLLPLEALDKFSEWAYVHQNNITDFNIALLATGAVFEGTENCYTRPANACVIDGASKRHQSVILLPLDPALGSSCAPLVKALGLLLGAPLDSSTGPYSGCQGQGYITGNPEDHCGEKQYFFSKCSDKGIANYVKSGSASCLQNSGNKEADDIAASGDTLHPPSLTDQCVLLTNDSNAIADVGNNPCIMSKCYVMGNESTTIAQNLYPVDNSPCGDKKYCFRGRCLPYGFQIRDVYGGYCLYSSDRFSGNDQLLTLNPCSSSPTPLDKFRIVDMGKLGTFLATPYSTPDASENDDKCLSADLHEKKVVFKKCSSNEQKWLGWDLIEVPKIKGAFMLRNRLTKKCVNGNISPYFLECNESERQHMLWKFHDHNPPENVFVKPTTEDPIWISEQPARKDITAIPTQPSNVQVVEKSSQFVDTNYGEPRLTKALTMDMNTPLPASSQRSSQNVSTNHWSIGLNIFIFGIVTGCIVVYGVQKCKVYRRSRSPPLNRESQMFPLCAHENTNGTPIL